MQDRGSVPASPPDCQPAALCQLAPKCLRAVLHRSVPDLKKPFPGWVKPYTPDFRKAFKH